MRSIIISHILPRIISHFSKCFPSGPLRLMTASSPAIFFSLARHAPESLVLCEGGLDRLQNLGEMVGMVGKYGKTYNHMYLSVEMLGKHME